MAESNPVENYISMLVRGSEKVAQDTTPTVADVQNAPDAIPVLHDAGDSGYVRGSITNSATGKYLSVDICSLTCIIPVSEVITVRRYSRALITHGIELLDPGHHFADSRKSPNDYNFMVVLKAETQVALLTDSLNGIVAIADNDLRWRRTAASRPWFKAVSSDSRHLLLDWRVLHAMHTSPAHAGVLA